MIIDTLVEGTLDEAVAIRLITHCGHDAGVRFGKKGWNYIFAKIKGFNIHARYGNPMLTLVDFMDTGLDCPPEIQTTWLPDRCNKMLLRAVVHEIESWLLADREGMARFLGLSVDVIPKTPEELPNPKQTLINLVRRSRKKQLRDSMLPPPKVSSIVGPSYNAELEKFAVTQWRIESAIQRSHSLCRCVERLRELHGIQ
jgi:hypothetical protein